MSSRTKNWNVRQPHPSYMPKSLKAELREKRRKRMEYRRRYGWTSQNLYASLYVRKMLEA